jgi:hypothetical protein
MSKQGYVTREIKLNKRLEVWSVLVGQRYHPAILAPPFLRANPPANRQYYLKKATNFAVLPRAEPLPVRSAFRLTIDKFKDVASFC